MKLLTFTILSLLITSCSTSPIKSELETVFKKMSDNEYNHLINQYSQNDKKYSGLYNTYQVSVTMITSEIDEALLQREGFFMQWSAEKAQREREKRFQQRSASAKFFISMFTPKRDYNELHRRNSMWKVYIESNGQRYMGKVALNKQKLAQVKNLYPYHRRFNKAYIAEFNIPMSALEKQNTKIIITSSLGNTVFSFTPPQPQID